MHFFRRTEPRLQRSSQPSFRTLLIGRFLFLTFVSVLAVSLFGGAFLARQMEQDAVRQLRGSALRVRDGLEGYLRLHQLALAGVSRTLSVEAGPVEAGKELSTAHAAIALDSMTKTYTGFLTLLATNREGKIIRAVRRGQRSFTPVAGEAQWVKDRQYFKEAKASAKAFVSGVFQGRGLGSDPIVALSEPLFDAAGNFIGVLEGSIDVQKIPLALRDEDSSMLVVAHDAEQRIVYSTQPERLAPMQTWVPALVADGQGDKPFELFPLAEEEQGRKSTPYLAVGLGVNVGGWRVIAALPKAEMEKELTEFYWTAAFVLVLLCGFTWQAADLIAASIAQPIESLARDMQSYELSGNTKGRKKQVGIAAELSKIQTEFLKMGERLGASFGQVQAALRDRDAKNLELNALLQDLDLKVTERTAQLAESEARFALAVRGTNIGIWDWDLGLKKLYYSDRWKQMLGIGTEVECDSIEDWLGRVHPADRERVQADLENYIQSGSTELLEAEHRIRHMDGTWRWVLSSGAAVRGADGVALRVAGSTTDITGGKLVDPLSGLHNRLAMIERLEQVISRERENPARDFSLLFLDLDRFKLVNDSLGHVKGDHLLFETSRRVLEGIEKVEGLQGSVGRLGGDEFVVLIENPASSGIALEVAHQIQRAMEAPFNLDGSTLFATVSIGIAHSNGEVKDAEDILRNADSAMYQAKMEGRGHYRLFDSSMHARAVARLELETDLRRALEAGEFILQYQPQVRLTDGRLAGFEALLRWQHPRRGLVPPGDFIPISEETGLILPLGRWVLENGCRQLAEWDREHSHCRELSMSINLSALQFNDASLVPLVQDVLRQTGLAPSRLRLEVTESMVASDPVKAQAVLGSLSDLGVGLEIDDFGTGYSCLSQLHQLPFDTLKIDRSFVLAMDEKQNQGQDGRKVVESIITLSANLGINVIAEGIETEANWVQLARLGCEFGQGYYFSRPLAAADALGVAELRMKEPWPIPGILDTTAESLSRLQQNLSDSNSTSPAVFPPASSKESRSNKLMLYLGELI